MAQLFRAAALSLAMLILGAFLALDLAAKAEPAQILPIVKAAAEICKPGPARPDPGPDGQPTEPDFQARHTLEIA